MDGTMANFLIMMVGGGVGGVVAIIGGISTCMMKSRCTHITSPCLSCDRDVIDEENSVYNQPVNPTPVINRV
jgi:hypothetical protein